MRAWWVLLHECLKNVTISHFPRFSGNSNLNRHLVIEILTCFSWQFRQSKQQFLASNLSTGSSCLFRIYIPLSNGNRSPMWIGSGANKSIAHFYYLWGHSKKKSNHIWAIAHFPSTSASYVSICILSRSYSFSVLYTKIRYREQCTYPDYSRACDLR